MQLKKLSNKINYDVLVDFNIDSLNNSNSDKISNKNDGSGKKTNGGMTEEGVTEVGKTESGVKRKLGSICSLVRPLKRDRLDSTKQVVIIFFTIFYVILLV